MQAGCLIQTYASLLLSSAIYGAVRVQLIVGGGGDNDAYYKARNAQDLSHSSTTSALTIYKAEAVTFLSYGGKLSHIEIKSVSSELSLWHSVSKSCS